MRALPKELIAAIKACRDQGMTRKEAAARLQLPLNKIISAATSYNIRGWPMGAAARNQTGIFNPNYVNGLSRATGGRTTKRVLIEAGKDLFTCERCGDRREIELPRHHKDRDISNNTAENLEVLCVSCHNKEHMSERTRVNGRFV